MNYLISLWILCLSFVSFGKNNECVLDSHKPIVSLSGPVSTMLEELGLLKDPSLKAISEYHPVDFSKFKGKVLKGGLFLSIKTFKEISSYHVFFDQSRDLRKNLEKLKASHIVEITSLGKTPFEVVEDSLKLLAPFLKHCETQMQDILTKVEKIKLYIKNSFNIKNEIIFYLGKSQESGKNRLIMVNDGPVAFLKKASKIKTYPSDLAYVIPSARILLSLKKPLYIGLLEAESWSAQGEKNY